MGGCISVCRVSCFPSLIRVLNSMQELSVGNSFNYLEIIFCITWRTHDLGVPPRVHRLAWVATHGRSPMVVPWPPRHRFVLVLYPHAFPGWRELPSRVLSWVQPSKPELHAWTTQLPVWVMMISVPYPSSTKH